VSELLQWHFVLSALSCFCLTVVSAIVPWVNAEIIVLSLPAVVETPVALVALVLVATAGQMTGKCAVYWVGRGGVRLPSPRIAATIERWRERQRKCRTNPLGLVLLSSAVGIPPFYVITVLAGVLRISFPRYLLFGTIGRLLRFGALVLVPYGLGRALG
jgi:membrane protein YqaA with SNARE-associated domain